MYFNFKLLSNVATIYEWRVYKTTNGDYLHNHFDAIKLMKQTQHQFCKIENLTKNNQSIEGNQICMFIFNSSLNIYSI